MNQRNNHIISRFKWNTVFDSKEQAFALQERISDWSRQHIQKEADRIFHQLCPTDQTWKIDQLEIDLGQIDYHNLEAELTERFRIVLAERLIDQVVNAQNNNANIAITSADVSIIDMLHSFLLQGVLPWYSNTYDLPVNQLLSDQLRDNFRRLISILLESGRHHVSVRKRMAWQISETNLRKILQGLEPNNHTQIIQFTNELVQIQEKENVVRAASGDFRKNVWLWILNYVYVERGSVFNEVSFMKSSIRQMANHYNSSYAELLSMIEEAVENMRIHTPVSSGLILVLQEVSRVNKMKVDDVYSDQPDKDHFDQLEKLLKGEIVQGSPLEKTLNDLVVHLCRRDRRRFGLLINSLNLSLNAWTMIAQSLSDDSLEVLVYAQHAHRADFIVEGISFLTKLCKELHLESNRPLLWATGIRNLRQHKDAATGNRLFMMDCILCLGKTNQMSWEKMLLQLVGAQVPVSCKTGTALDVFAALTDVFLIEISNRPPSFFNNRFIELTRSFDELSGFTDEGTEKIISLGQSLRKYMQLYPSGALELLVQHSSKEKIQKLFNNLIDNHTAGMLLKHAPAGSYHALLESFSLRLHKYGRENSSERMVKFIETHLMRAGLQVLVLFPGISSKEFTKKLLEELARQFPNSLHKPFTTFLQVLLSEKNEHGLEMFCPAIEALLSRISNRVTNWSVDEIMRTVEQGSRSIVEITAWLRLHFTSLDFVSIRKPGNRYAIILANYIAVGAGSMMDAYIEGYLQTLCAQDSRFLKPEWTKRLYDLFWKCLLDDHSHKGEIKKLKQIFTTAVLAHFSIANQPIKEDSYSGKAITIPGCKRSTYADIINMFRQCIDKCETIIMYDGQTIEITELLSYVMDVDAAEPFRILSALTLSEKQITFIASTFSFDEIAACIMDRDKESTHRAIEDMKLLMHLSLVTENEHEQKAIEKDFVQQAISLLSHEEWAVNNILQRFIKNNPSSKEIIAIIEDKSYQPGPVLKAALIEHMPVLAELLTGSAADRKRERLSTINKKGLLDSLVESLLMNAKIPFWFATDHTEEAGELLNDVATHYPVFLYRLLARKKMTDEQLRKFEICIDTTLLFRSIAGMNSSKRVQIAIVSQLYQALANTTVHGISGATLQSLLFKEILKAWVSKNWEALSVHHLWNTLAWDCCLVTGLEKTDFLSGISLYRSRFPVSLQASLDQYQQKEKQREESPQPPPALKPIKRLNSEILCKEKTGEGIVVRNAGLVLLSNYIPLLFERLGVTAEGKFMDLQAQNDAIHYLQYLVTGNTSTEEHLLPLNKILCGLELSEPITDSILLTAEQEEMMEGLLYGVIDHWPDAGSNTPDGLRGNWLVRNGMLHKVENGWSLSVEKKSYDLLLQRTPFSFSIIKLPWMRESLTVKWLF